MKKNVFERILLRSLLIRIAVLVDVYYFDETNSGIFLFVIYITNLKNFVCLLI